MTPNTASAPRPSAVCAPLIEPSASVSPAAAARAVRPCLPLRGLREVIAFNRPLYLLAGGVVLLSTTVTFFATRAPSSATTTWLSASAIVVALPALFWILASLIATWWTYDRSAFRRWTWLAPRLPFPPRRYTVLHAGLDEASAPLARLFPLGLGTSLDLFDPGAMTEPSIRRARALLHLTPATSHAPVHAAPSAAPHPPVASATPAAPAAPLPGAGPRLPIDDDATEAHFLILAAHELRRPAARDALFDELHRTLRPGGVVVLVEHLRDGWNFAAYGPGFFHFLPAREWRRLAAREGWETMLDEPLTPWLRQFIWRKPQYAPFSPATMARYRRALATQPPRCAELSADPLPAADSRTGQRRSIAALHLFEGP
ncbi:MAG: hypothetical protein ACREJ2_02130 [Planctomycetota bacterium]